MPWHNLDHNEPEESIYIAWVMPEYTAGARPRSGVGVKKINVSPYTPLAKFRPVAPLPRAILDSPDRAESKLALSSVAPAI